MPVPHFTLSPCPPLYGHTTYFSCLPRPSSLPVSCPSLATPSLSTDHTLLFCPLYHALSSLLLSSSISSCLAPPFSYSGPYLLFTLPLSLSPTPPFPFPSLLPRPSSRSLLPRPSSPSLSLSLLPRPSSLSLSPAPYNSMLLLNQFSPSPLLSQSSLLPLV